MSDRLRAALATTERYPVAILDKRAIDALGSLSQTVWLSSDTAIKQAIHRNGQQLPAVTWGRLQDVIDAAEWVENEGGNRLIYYHEGGDPMVAVIKVAQNKSDAWLLSMRRGNERELHTAITTGRTQLW